jgi:threonine dehydrogenase-like Zn-dependent dehydrogenase
MVPSVAVRPRAPRSLHLIDIPLPPLGPDDVLVRVKEVGYCGTDREIIEGHFGSAPDGFASLVIGHETLGMVETVGSNISTLHPGDLVTSTARRPCDCPQCLGGEPDFCSAFGYRERGIIGLHGYLTERFIEREEHLVKVPEAIAHLGVLTEPTSVAEKAWRVAEAVQSRLTTWRPESAFVIGAGPIGVLTTLVLRANGLAVTTLDLKPTPNTAESVVSKAGATYVCTHDLTTDDLTAALPRADVIVECTGNSAAVFMAMELLANNGVLVSLSVTGGNRELAVPADKLNLEFVLGNKVWVGSVNSSLADFASAVRDLERFETLWPGLTSTVITRRLTGLASALDLPEAGFGSLKTVIEV